MSKEILRTSELSFDLAIFGGRFHTGPRINRML